MNKLLLIAFVSISSHLVFGHGDHKPKVAICAKECTKEQVEAAVPKAIATLVSEGEIPSSWTSAKVEAIEQKTFKKGPEWVVTLAGAKQEKRYIFITTKGLLNGSNTTGN